MGINTDVDLINEKCLNCTKLCKELKREDVKYCQNYNAKKEHVHAKEVAKSHYNVIVKKK